MLCTSLLLFTALRPCHSIMWKITFDRATKDYFAGPAFFGRNLSVHVSIHILWNDPTFDYLFGRQKSWENHDQFLRSRRLLRGKGAVSSFGEDEFSPCCEPCVLIDSSWHEESTLLAPNVPNVSAGGSSLLSENTFSASSTHSGPIPPPSGLCLTHTWINLIL